MSYLILKEIVSLRTAIAIMIGAVGVGITAYGGLSGSTPFGMAMAALCALMLAASFTLLRAWREVDPVASIMLGSAGAAVFSFGFADPMVIEGASLFWAFVLGLILAPISFALISIGPKYIPSAEVSLIMLLETLLGPLWVWAALGEVPAMTMSGFTSNIDAIERVFGPLEDRRLLDIGCGGGRLLRALSRRGAVPTGVDPSEEMVARASALAPDATVRQSGGEVLPFEDGEFEGAISRNSRLLLRAAVRRRNFRSNTRSG